MGSPSGLLLACSPLSRGDFTMGNLAQKERKLSRLLGGGLRQRKRLKQESDNQDRKVITKTRKKGPGLWLPAAPPPQACRHPLPRTLSLGAGGGQGGGKTLQEPPRSQDSGGQLWDLNSGLPVAFPPNRVIHPLPFCSSIAVDSVRVGKSPSRASGLFERGLLLASGPQGLRCLQASSYFFQGLGRESLWLSVQGKSRRRRL